MGTYDTLGRAAARSGPKVPPLDPHAYAHKGRGRTAGLPKRSWIKISQIRTLSVERIGKRIAQASPEEVAQVVEGLTEIIGD